jgi:hypothetical protein
VDRFRILSIDGGGIRGLIPALVVEELERRLSEAAGEKSQLSDYFHLLAGTSTGGLIALGLTAPDGGAPGRARMDGPKLVSLYRREGPRIFAFSFQRVRSLGGWLGPKHSPAALRRAVEEQLGPARLSEALRDVVVTAYDMTGREPQFFKRWRALERADRNPPIADAAMATAAAPTYFPSSEVAGGALVDGGVFASNPTVAAISEALKRSDEPADLHPHDLLVVSLGTGERMRELGFPQSKVRRWGKIGWIRPRSGEPPLLGAMLDGQSDAADHWAHMLLNHEPGDPPPAKDDVGHGPRYFRLQAKLRKAYAMDNVRKECFDGLTAAAEELIARRSDELDEIAQRLVRAGPIAPLANAPV